MKDLTVRLYALFLISMLLLFNVSIAAAASLDKRGYSSRANVYIERDLYRANSKITYLETDLNDANYALDREKNKSQLLLEKNEHLKIENNNLNDKLYRMSLIAGNSEKTKRIMQSDQDDIFIKFQHKISALESKEKKKLFSEYVLSFQKAEAFFSSIAK